MVAADMVVAVTVAMEEAVEVVAVEDTVGDVEEEGEATEMAGG